MADPFRYTDWGGDELLVTETDRRVNGRRILQVSSARDAPRVELPETEVATLVDYLMEWLNRA